MARVRVGIAGWTFEPWRGVFYPPHFPQKHELPFASRQFNSLELNGSFYSLQTPTSYKKWHDETPDDFVFALKGGRFITHMKRLNDIRVPVATFFASGTFALGKLGPIFWQFPPNMKFDEQKFATFFELLPRTTQAAAKLAGEHTIKVASKVLLDCEVSQPMRHAVEVRHESFITPAFVNLCNEHNVAVVIADTIEKFAFDEITADFAYVRMHGEATTYPDGYTKPAIDRWAKRIETWSKKGDVYVYFDVENKIHSPRDAMAMSKRLKISWNPK